MDGTEYDLHLDHNIEPIDEISDSFPSDRESNENFVGFQTFSLFQNLQNQ